MVRFYKSLLMLLIVCIALFGVAVGAAQAGAPVALSFAIRLEGPITSITPQADGSAIWQVKATDVVVRPTTEIRPVGYEPEAGRDYVTVEATLEGLQFVALHITVQTDADAAALNELEFRGLISAGPSGAGGASLRQTETWTIGGRDVDLGGKATVIGEPEPGRYAHVKGRLLRSGVVKASRVEVFEAAQVMGKFEFKGVIQEMAEETPGYWVIDGMRGVVSQDTEIIGDPVVGAVAEVRGVRQSGDEVLFQQIRVEATNEVVRLEGIIQEYDLEAGVPRIGHLVVQGEHIEITPMTFIDESRARAASGMWADVVAHREGRLLYAQRIKVERPD